MTFIFYLLSQNFNKLKLCHFLKHIFNVCKNPSVQQDRYRLKKSRKKEDNYSWYGTILFIIAFDLFKHMSLKSCRQGMVWFDAD